MVCLEDRSSVHCFFLDFAKAFESVLLKRLTYLVSLSGFLTCCFQSVVINRSHSQLLPVSFGVWFVNDIQEVV